jgi:hypothetical protein
MSKRPTQINDNPSTKSIGKHLFQLTADHTLYFTHRGDKCRITIKAGFEYDGATIPRWSWSILGKSPKGTHDAGTIFHDIVYMLVKNIQDHALLGRSADECTHIFEIHQSGKWRKAVQRMSRKECDQIMFDIIETTQGANLSRFQRVAMYYAIRLGGGKYWKQSTPLHKMNPTKCQKID